MLHQEEQLMLVYLLTLEMMLAIPKRRKKFTAESAKQYLKSHTISRCLLCERYYINIITVCKVDGTTLVELLPERANELIHEWEAVRLSLAQIDGQMHTPFEAVDWHYKKSQIGREILNDQ